MTEVLSNQVNLSVLNAEPPAWLPPIGQYGAIPMTNTALSTKPPIPPGYDPTWHWGPFGGLLNEYSGAAFSSDYSPLGCICIHGGGDGGWWGNGVHIGDLSTLTWSRAVETSPATLAPNYPASVLNINNDGVVADGTPGIAVHVYSSCETIPVSWNVGPPSYVRPQLPNRAYKLFGMAASLFGGPWRNFTQSNTFSWSGASSVPMCARDDNRQCFYVTAAWGSGTDRYWRIDKNGGVTQILGGFSLGGIVRSMGYCPSLDILLSIQGDGVFALRRIDVAGSPGKPGATGTPPTYSGGNGQGVEWDPDRNCFIFWDAAAERIYKLHPPSGDPMTTPWTWTNELITKSATYPPVTPPANSAGGQWSKFRRIPALQAFVYPASMLELQIVRPS